MRRRPRTVDLSSLEMLLDTMCNTFGCIIFIAILLAVLVRQVGDAAVRATQAAAPSPESSRRQALQVEELRAALEALEETAASLETLHQIDTVRLPDLSEPVREAQTRAGHAQAAAEETRRQLGEARARVQALRDEARRLEAATRQLREQAAQTAPAAVREFRVPQLHPAHPESVCNCVLRGGRFYAVRVPGQGFAEDDVEVSRTVDGSYAVSLRPGAGQPIGATPEAAAGRLREALALDPLGTLIEFIVYPDSFGEFIRVKQWFVERGFSYNWRPHPPDAPLRYGQAAGIEQQ